MVQLWGVEPGNINRTPLARWYTVREFLVEFYGGEFSETVETLAGFGVTDFEVVETEDQEP